MPSDPNACLRCGAQLQSIGQEEFRIGGTSGGWKMLFGEWAELSDEQAQPIGKNFVAYEGHKTKRASSSVWRVEGRYVRCTGGGSHGASRSRLGQSLREKPR